MRAKSFTISDIDRARANPWGRSFCIYRLDLFRCDYDRVGAEDVTFLFDDLDVMRRVLLDLEQLEEGTLDTSTILATAPVVEDYRLVLGWTYGMKGVVSGHPRLPDGREIVTSQLMYLERTLGLARTMNRWYRVGTPHQKGRH